MDGPRILEQNGMITTIADDYKAALKTAVIVLLGPGDGTPSRCNILGVDRRSSSRKGNLLPSRPVIIIGRVFRRARSYQYYRTARRRPTGNEYSTTHHTLVLS